MNSHLGVSIDRIPLALPPDASIELEDVNPYFNDITETTSFGFQVPVKDNRQVFGNIDDVLSDKRLVSLENKPMQVSVDGMPYRTGKVATSENQELDKNITISFTSLVRSLSDYFGKLTCQDIPLKDRIQIGEMIGDIRVTYKADVIVHWKAGETGGKSKNQGSYESWHTIRNKQGGANHKLPALGFSTPFIAVEKNSSTHVSDGTYDTKTGRGKDPTISKVNNVEQNFINVSDPYPEAKYCNARVCYKHYGLNEDGTSSDAADTSTIGDDMKFNPYLMLEAQRPASGICFYVMYFLDCLFAYLKDYGISYDNSGLMGVTDFKRLCFFTTQCNFDLERKYSGSADFNSVNAINNWLATRNCGGQISIEWQKSKKLESAIIDGVGYSVGDDIVPGWELKDADISLDENTIRTTITGNVMKMFANSKNFPKESVQTIIDSLWASFGIRFYLNQETMEVKPIFIRDLLRDNSEPIRLNAKVITATKCSEKITGFRMKYSAESDKDEQRNNILNGVRDYDTRFDYMDYRNLNTSETYGQIIKHSGISDMTLYVDRTTGNKYRVKVSADAETVDEYHPVIFEVGQFNGVEIGDCSDENEDFVQEVSSSFQPLDFNDINGRNEKKAGTNATEVFTDDEGNPHTLSCINLTDKEQVLAAFVDEDMWHEHCLREIQTAFGDDFANFFIKESCRTRESFDNTQSDSGNSPLQEKDWELAIAIMRGGGANAKIQYYDYNYDGFGNSKWRTEPGIYGLSSDNIDCWGAHYDYNGQLEGIGPEDRISLKIRAYIEDPQTGEILCNSEPKIARRGLYDQFMSDYAYFLLNRKVVKLEVDCEPSELLNIKWAKRYDIDGYVGWINKISSRITAENGLEKVTVEMYIL